MAEHGPRMLETGDTYRVHKTRHRVRITQSDGVATDGYLFLGSSERILDVLNDARRFLPLEAAEGQLILMAKSAILRVEPIEDTAGADPGLSFGSPGN